MERVHRRSPEILAARRVTVAERDKARTGTRLERKHLVGVGANSAVLVLQRKRHERNASETPFAPLDLHWLKRRLHDIFRPLLAVAPSNYANLARLVSHVIPNKTVFVFATTLAPMRNAVDEKLRLVAARVDMDGRSFSLAPRPRPMRKYVRRRFVRTPMRLV